MSVAIGTLFGEDQRALEDLDLLPRESDEEEEEDEDEDEDEEQDDVEAEISSSALAPNSTSSVVVPSFGGTGEISRDFRQGRAGGIPWFEEMVEGSRLGRLMRARRGMGVSDDNSTSIEWEVSEWHDDGGGGFMRQEESHYGKTSTGKRKRGRQADLDSPQKRV